MTRHNHNQERSGNNSNFLENDEVGIARGNHLQNLLEQERVVEGMTRMSSRQLVEQQRSTTNNNASWHGLYSLAQCAQEAETLASTTTTTITGLAEITTSSSAATTSSTGSDTTPVTHYQYDPVEMNNHTLVIEEHFPRLNESGDESISKNSDSLSDPYSEFIHPVRRKIHHSQGGALPEILCTHSGYQSDRKPSARKTQKRSRDVLIPRSRTGEEDSSDDSEGGYAGSESSNTTDERQQGSSEESSEESCNDCDVFQQGKETGPNRRFLCQKVMKQSMSDSSSEIADFSSTDESTCNYLVPSPTRSSYKKMRSSGDNDSLLTSKVQSSQADRANHRSFKKRRVHIADTSTHNLLNGETPIMSIGFDAMAHVLTFLEPPNVMEVLTMPLSKDWVNQYTRQPELWRVLCFLEPFKANKKNSSGYDSDADDDFVGLFPLSGSALLFASDKSTFGKFRLLYSSFVKCMRYLIRIKDDAVNGRSLSVLSLANETITKSSFAANRNLQKFLAQVRGSTAPAIIEQVVDRAPIGLLDNEQVSRRPCPTKSEGIPTKTVKYGHSIITQRLLGPSVGGSVAEIELPWSCAIYSIINWMVAFANVEGIQIMCLQVMPFLLEDEQQRITAQRVGLTDIILRSMLLFQNSAKLHTAAFHTIVLLARPLGGREGMLFHTSMINSAGIFAGSAGQSTAISSANSQSGIAVLLDSMRRFRNDNDVQSTGCWSFVNIALAPAQKEVLVKLGGIEVTTEAMMAHPQDAEVQFRALFALINLVIPCPTNAQQQDGDFAREADEPTERDVLDHMVDQIINLVVLSIKHFYSNEAIANRACLVLHNLSLVPEYIPSMLQTPSCFQILNWCLQNYRTDQALQQSAAVTLHRLQIALSNDERLQSRFARALHNVQASEQ